MNSSISQITPLNDAQEQAVTSTAHYTLVLAGAGSGKTRVLVHRIAWLVKTQEVSPYGILAVTFTNKAAGEMRSRVEKLLQMSVQSMWIGTFHGLAHRLLRAHFQEANLPNNFQIIDSDDQQRLLKRILTNLNLDEKQYPPKQIQSFVNGRKDEGLRADQVKPLDAHGMTLKRIYQTYEELCQRSGLVDFAELLLRAYELLKNDATILLHYQQRFQHILVDEFQDTNTIQYEWLKLFLSGDNHLTVVGDDDQSIYGWRGAKIENIQDFYRQFNDTLTVKLEENYRSTEYILNAANHVIANNTNRLGKELKPVSGLGEPVRLYAAFNDLEEAHFLVSQLRHWAAQGYAYEDMAILYRSNAQSRIIEEALIASAIPYRIYGGFRFFERAEIKDALAYLRIVYSRYDDAAFERIINTPTRGIGEQTLMTIRELAKLKNCSLWDAVEFAIDEKSLSGRALSALAGFIELIQGIQSAVESVSLLAEQMEIILNASGLIGHYRQEKGEKAQAKLENLEELINAASQFVSDNSAATPMQAFLSHAALESGDSQNQIMTQCVQLMTLHTAKGLEFKIVFICGLEDGLFPHELSIRDNHKLEEERRLCYVGITRAREKLYLTYAESRRLHGKADALRRPSRFLSEIPAEFLEEIRPRAKVSRPVTRQFQPQRTSDEIYEGLHLGQRVRHPKFGYGVITNYEGRGDSARIAVKFEKEGLKWLIAGFARLAVA